MALTVSLHKKSSGVTIYKVYCILNLNTKDFSRSPSNTVQKAFRTHHAYFEIASCL